MATVTYTGSRSARVTAVTLSPTSVIGVAHALPTTPEEYGQYKLYAGANTSLSSAYSISADATTITFTAGCGQAIGVDAWFRCLHSISK